MFWDGGCVWRAGVGGIWGVAWFAVGGLEMKLSNNCDYS